MSTVSVTTSITDSSSSNNGNTYLVENGGTLVVSGAGVIVTSATVDAGGTLDLYSGAASNTSVSGGNTATNVTLANGGTLELVTAKAATSGSLTMSGSGNALVLDKILSNGNVASVTISGFGAGDAVEIAGGYTSDALSYVSSGSNTSVTFTASGTGNTETFIFNGALVNDFDLLATSNGVSVASGVSGTSATSGVELLYGSNVTVSSGATLYVYAGGAASGTTVNSGGTLNLSGVASNAAVNSGGVIDLETASATLTGSLTFSGGHNDLVVLATANSGAGDQAAISGFAAGDQIDIETMSASSATLSFSTSAGNEIVTVTSGAVSESFVFSGTTAYTSNNLTISADAGGNADLEIATGGVTISVTTPTASGAYNVVSNNTLLVEAGGSVSAATIQNGAFLTVNGGADVGSLISSGGVETIVSGSASGDQIYGSATVAAAGSVTSETVETGGSLVINGGNDLSATVQSGGGETVSAGGSATGDMISGSLTVSGATISDETISAGGQVTLNGGAVDIGMTLLAGATLFVSAATGSAKLSGDSIYGTVNTVSGLAATYTNETVYNGGQLNLQNSNDGVDITVSSGGLLTLSGKENAVNTVLTGGATVELESPKALLTSTVISGATTPALTFENGLNTLSITNLASLTSGGVSGMIDGFGATDQVVVSGAFVAGSEFDIGGDGKGDVVATVSNSSSGETDILTFSGSAPSGETLGWTSAGPTEEILQYVAVTGTVVSTSTASGAYDVFGGSSIEVVAGGSVSAVTVGYQGNLTIAGGVDSGAIVSAGGVETVSAGSASGDQIYGSTVVDGGTASGETVLSGGVLNVTGGVASMTVVNGGALDVNGGGTAAGVTLVSGATLDVSGANASVTGGLTFASASLPSGGVTLPNGDVYYQDGRTSSGQMALSSGAILTPSEPDTLKVENGGVVSAVISGFSTSAGIDLAGVSGASLSFTSNANGTETAIVSGVSNGVAVGDSFTFAAGTLASYASGSTAQGGTMNLVSDGAGGVVLVEDATPQVTITTLNNLTTNQSSETLYGAVNIAADPLAIDSTVNVYDGQNLVGSATVGADGYWSADITGLTNGTHSFTATDTDAAGNTGTSGPLTTTVNTTAPAFAAGSLVVSVYGDGAGTGGYQLDQAAPIALDDLSLSGSGQASVVSQVVLPVATSGANSVISGEYGSASEGTLELSGDGHSLVIAGYGVSYAAFDAASGAAIYGTSALGQSMTIEPAGSNYALVPRVVADVSATGVVDTSTAITGIYNSNNPRSVATYDGTTFYLSGQGAKGSTNQGVFEATDGASSATALDTATDTRTAEIYNGQLYVSVDSTQGGTTGTTNISDYGTLPLTSTASPTILQGLGASVTLTAANANTVNAADVGQSVDLSPENFFFANADTLYVADSGTPKNGGVGDGGLQKWVYDGSQWNLEYTLSQGLNLVDSTTASSGNTGLIGLTGQVESNGTVQLYATNETYGELDQSYLYGITDTLSATAPADNESFSLLMTAAPDTIIRGIAFAPSTADASQISGVPTTTQSAQEGTPVTPFAGVTITDATSGATDTVTISVSGLGGTLVDGANFTGTPTLTEVGAGVYTLNGSASAVTAELDDLTFTADNTVADPTTTFTISDQNSVNSAPTTQTVSLDDTLCFLTGTMIRTPDGEAAVETLKRGDLVLTSDGRAMPVLWLGRLTVSKRFCDPVRSLPIRIRKDALGENRPCRDLLVSPDHALLVEDVLIHAGALVNGSSITRETDAPEIFVYYHVELDDHSLILAENVPAETFIDNVERLAFDNWAEHEALYPQGKSIEEMPHPRAKARRQVPMRIRAALDRRAEEIGTMAIAAA